MQRNSTSTSPDSSKENISTWRSMCSIWNNLWQDVNSKEIGKLCPCGSIDGCSFHGFTRDLDLLPPYIFPQMIHMPDLTKPLGSLASHIWLHIHRFTHCPLSGTLPSLPGILLKSDPEALPFCIYLKPAQHGWWKGLLPAGEVARHLSLLAVYMGCLDQWAL